MTVVVALEHTTAKYNTLTVVRSMLPYSHCHRCGGTGQYACFPPTGSGEERREVGRGGGEGGMRAGGIEEGGKTSRICMLPHKSRQLTIVLVAPHSVPADGLCGITPA